MNPTSIGFLMFICFNFCRCNPYKNKPCNLTNGLEGVCEIVDNCPILSIDGSTPAVCGIHEKVAFLCCQRGSKLAHTTHGNRIPGEISKKKCKEYSEYVYEWRDPVIPLVHAPKIKVYDCHFLSIPLVVGGRKSLAREFPHMALIGYKYDGKINWDCGGTIIHEEYILTAAHCVFHSKKHVNPMYIAVGFTEKSHVNDNAQFVKVIKTIPHPDSVSDLLSNDIGLLKVQKLNFTTYVRPACLNTNSTIQVDRAIATGWGKLGFRRNSSDALLKVNLNLFTMEQCRAQMGNINMNISEGKHICAGSMTEIKDTCSGDSGGPLQVFHDDSVDKARCMYDIIGVTSFGKQCGLKVGNPGIYTRVSEYIQWIEDIVWPNE